MSQSTVPRGVKFRQLLACFNGSLGIYEEAEKFKLTKHHWVANCRGYIDVIKDHSNFPWFSMLKNNTCVSLIIKVATMHSVMFIITVFNIFIVDLMK